MISVSETILGAFKWLARHWYIPLIALASIAGWLAGRRRLAPSEAVANHLAEIRNDREFERFAVERGAKLANDLLDQEYRRTLSELHAKQRRKADDLRRNPGKRVRYLRAISKRLGHRATDNND